MSRQRTFRSGNTNVSIVKRSASTALGKDIRDLGYSGKHREKLAHSSEELFGSEIKKKGI